MRERATLTQFHRLSQNLQVTNSVCLAPTAGTQNGASVDTLGYRRGQVAVTINTGAGTTINFQVQDSPDGITWTNVSGATLGTPVAASTAEATYLVDVDFAKRQRYVRVQLIGTGTAGFMVANVLLGQPEADLLISQEQAPLSV